jgi:long-chain fatty acid transport protein
VGAGATIGVMVKPSDSFQIGVAWRSALTTDLNGDGELVLNPADDPTPVEVAHRQEWPQQASLGFAWRLGKLKLAAAADWTDWSRVDKIIIEFKGQPGLNQVYHVDFVDNFAVHGGGELTVSDTLALRAGYTFDSNAVPDRTIERQYLDADKHCVAAGVGFQLSKRWRIDTAFEYLFGPVRTIEDNSQEMAAAGWPARANVSPGEHSGSVFTFELQAQYRY